MRQLTEHMAVVVKDVRDGPTCSLILDQRVDEVLKFTMFVDPVDKFQKKNLAQAWGASGPSELWILQPSCAAPKYVGQ